MNIEGYLIYLESIKKIENSDIPERIKKFKRKEDAPYISEHCFADDLIWMAKHMKEKKYFDILPEEFSKNYREKLNNMYKETKNYFWEVKYNDGIHKEELKLQDLSLFIGWNASLIMTKKNIWNYKKYGFSSVSEFIATTSAYFMKNSGYGIEYEGHSWMSKRDGKDIVTKISGDNNFDLRVYQRDVTSYETKDPFGNSIGLRPFLSKDFSAIAPHHSTEPLLLMSLLKYAEQEKIDVSFTKDGAKSLIEWGKSLGQRGAGCTEHFGGFDTDPFQYVLLTDYPLAKLNENNQTKDRSFFWIGCSSDSGYVPYITHDGNLTFGYEDGKNEKQKTPKITFTRDDVEEAVKGIIYQCANGIGRTSANQIFSILDYKYTGKYEKDKKKFSK